MLCFLADGNSNQAIEEILLIAECSLPDEWEGQVHYLPLR